MQSGPYLHRGEVDVLDPLGLPKVSGRSKSNEILRLDDVQKGEEAMPWKGSRGYRRASSVGFRVRRADCWITARSWMVGRRGDRRVSMDCNWVGESERCWWLAMKLGMQLLVVAARTHDQAGGGQVRGE